MTISDEMESTEQSAELCINCQSEVLTMAFKGSGVCSNKCAKEQGRGTFTSNEIRHKIADLIAEIESQREKDGENQMLWGDPRRLIWQGRLEIIRRLELILQ